MDEGIQYWIGMIIVSVAVGVKFTVPDGWIAFGSILMVFAVLKSFLYYMQIVARIKR